MSKIYCAMVNPEDCSNITILTADVIDIINNFLLYQIEYSPYPLSASVSIYNQNDDPNGVYTWHNTPELALKGLSNHLLTEKSHYETLLKGVELSILRTLDMIMEYEEND